MGLMCLQPKCQHFVVSDDYSVLASLEQEVLETTPVEASLLELSNQQLSGSSPSRPVVAHSPEQGSEEGASAAGTRRPKIPFWALVWVWVWVECLVACWSVPELAELF